MRVLICGGGVIGTSIAYFLSQRGIEAVVIERTGIANAASGKSGGFLALDWCDGSPVEALARRSFDLHAELAQRIDDEWGYRRLDTLGVVTSARRDVGFYRKLAAPDWLAGDGGGACAPRHRRDHGPGKPRRLHRRHDAGGARRGCAVDDRHRHRPGARRRRFRARHRGGRAGDRRRCGRHRHGPMVGSSQPMAGPCRRSMG